MITLKLKESTKSNYIVKLFIIYHIKPTRNVLTYFASERVGVKAYQRVAASDLVTSLSLA